MLHSSMIRQQLHVTVTELNQQSPCVYQHTRKQSRKKSTRADTHLSGKCNPSTRIFTITDTGEKHVLLSPGAFLSACYQKTHTFPNHSCKYSSLGINYIFLFSNCMYVMSFQAERPVVDSLFSALTYTSVFQSTSSSASVHCYRERG